jgi:ariadne-1
VPDQRVKVKQWLLDSFVTGSRQIKWCPGAKCTRAIRYPGGGMQGITCDCYHAWCFACGGTDHTPVGCSMAEAW